MSFLVGVDLGQAQDYTAFAMIEQDEGTPARYAIRHLHRFPIGTPYPAIVDEVRRTLHRPPCGRTCRSWSTQRGWGPRSWST